MRWLLGHYGRRVVAALDEQYGYRRLSRKVFEYWRWVLASVFHRRRGNAAGSSLRRQTFLGFGGKTLAAHWKRQGTAVL